MIMGVVADDITGSNDIGIMFAKSGLRVHVYTYESEADQARFAGELSEPDIVILNTNSRLDSPNLAYRKVFTATRLLQEAGCRQFFNKTCSVFRGNIGTEFDAMLDALGQEFAVVVLGFPKNGRTTVDGIHLVRGVRLEESEFRNDPIHPMTRSDLVGILAAQTKRQVGLVTHRTIDQGSGALRQALDDLRTQMNYVILDVTGQHALRTIAEAVHDEPVLCGSSALAEELPEVWGAARPQEQHLALPSQPGLGVLVVAGSLMPQTAAQVEHLSEGGMPTLELEATALFDPASREQEMERLAAAASAHLLQGKDVLIHTPNTREGVAATRQAGSQSGLAPTETARQVSAAIAAVTAAVLERTAGNRLVVAGGETSAAVCEHLGVRGLRVWKEIQPGLPSCLSLGDQPRLLVLKSGSFGTPSFLAEAIHHVKSE